MDLVRQFGRIACGCDEHTMGVIKWIQIRNSTEQSDPRVIAEPIEFHIPPDNAGHGQPGLVAQIGLDHRQNLVDKPAESTRSSG